MRKVDDAIGRRRDTTGIEIVRKEIETRIGNMSQPTEIVIVTGIMAGGMTTGQATSRREGTMMMNIVDQENLDVIETGTERDTRSQKETGIGERQDSVRRATLPHRLRIPMDRNSKKYSRHLNMLVECCRLILKLRHGTVNVNSTW
jgi:hypothetical protein